MDHHRHLAEARSQTTRAAGKTAKAHRQQGLTLADQVARLPDRTQQIERCGKLALEPATTQPGDGQFGNLVAVLAHQLAFHTVLGAQPEDPETALTELIRHCQCREHMPTGAACHDQDGATHRAALPLAFSCSASDPARRIKPTMAEKINSEEPP